MKIHMPSAYFILFFCLLGAICPEARAGDPASASLTFKQDKLIIHTAKGDRNFSIEIADTPQKQEYGLMFRKTLPRDRGMLFIWNQDAPVAMWMKNTLIPLDMLFIDDHGKIVYIAANATPESTVVITANQPVRAVIELAGGTAALDGIKVGDSVIHSYFKP